MKISVSKRDKYFLELKDYHESINGNIKELHVELDKLTEQILKIETEHESIFLAENYNLESKLTYVEYIQSKIYIDRVKVYIHTVKDALGKYQKLQDELNFYIKNPEEIKNITPNIAECYGNVTESIRNYPYISSRLHQLLSTFDSKVSQLITDAKEYTLTFHSSLADIRYSANDISYSIGSLQQYKQSDEELEINNAENDEIEIVTEYRQEMDMSSDKLIQDSTKKGDVISSENKIKPELHIESQNLTENIAGFYSREQILSNIVSHNNIIESILLPIPIY
ncbi:hypothetical protein [Providencia sp. PROV130]|uniref:hypothetical protein n=1 Tax=Providencia sp. PROV130 TaxID=2949840 RepID=UPI00234AFD87|nr:hypothetical protein [Providencia sp. PROV130]